MAQTPDIEAASRPEHFAPPARFSHPPELQRPAPRDKPANYARSPHVRAWTQTSINTVVIGLALLVLGETSYVKKLGLFFSPLWVLDWIGVGIVILGVLRYVYKSVNDSRLRVYRDGEALIARVRSIGSSIEGAHPNLPHRFQVECDVQRSSGEIDVITFPDFQAFDPKKFEQMSLNIKPGEYTTAVMTPDGRGSLYGLLRIDPVNDLILHRGKPVVPMSALQSLTNCMLILCGAVLFFAAIHLLTFYGPLRGQDLLPMWLAISAGGILSAIIIYVLYPTLECFKNLSIWRRIAFSLLFGPIPGVLLGVVVVVAANSLGDSTIKHNQAFEVVKYTRTTHKILFHDYKISYRELDTNKKEDSDLLPDDMNALATTDLGVFEIGQGNLGMAWTRSIQPAVLVQVSAQGLPQDAPRVDVIVESPDGKQSNQQRVLCLRTSDNRFLTPPKDIVEYWAHREQKDGLPLIFIDQQGNDLSPEVRF